MKVNEGRAMGFVRPGGADAADGQPAASCRGEALLLPFDGGGGITFADGALHTIVFGSTGSGKTASVILPALRNLVRAGLGGIVADIKWTLTDRLRAIAAECGREQDVVEFGNGAGAVPLNLLAGLDRPRVEAFLRQVSGIGTPRMLSHNMDFALSGTDSAADVAELLRLLSLRDASLVPTLDRVLDALRSPEDARAMLALLERMAAADGATRAEKELFRRIRSNCFHPCMDPTGGRGGDRQRTEYDRQLEWRLHTTRGPLELLLECPGVRRGFCDPQGMSVDEASRMVLEERKIAVLRFSWAIGDSGGLLTRRLLEQWYGMILESGPPADGRPRSFAVLDEFQDIADLTPSNRYNDSAFLAKAREFGVVFIGASQSASALARSDAGSSPGRVESLLNNVNNRIFLYCDDPWTQQLAARHAEDVHLADMGPSEAFVVRYDAATRRHACGMRGLGDAYASAVPPAGDVAPMRQATATNPERPMLAQLIADAAQALERRLPHPQPPTGAGADAGTGAGWQAPPDSGPPRDEGRDRHAPLRIQPFRPAAVAARLPGEEWDVMAGDGAQAGGTDEMLTAGGRGREPFLVGPRGAAVLGGWVDAGSGKAGGAGRCDFANMPPGWRPHLLFALHKAMKTGESLKRLSVTPARITVTTADGVTTSRLGMAAGRVSSSVDRLFNDAVQGVCPLCGGYFPDSVGVCPTCQDALMGISSVGGLSGAMVDWLGQLLRHDSMRKARRLKRDIARKAHGPDAQDGGRDAAPPSGQVRDHPGDGKPRGESQDRRRPAGQGDGARGGPKAPDAWHGAGTVAAPCGHGVMWSLGAGSRGGGKAPAGAGKDAEVALCGGFAADEALRMVPVQDTSLAGEGAGIMVARFDRAGKIIAMRPIGDVLAGGEPAVPKDGNVRAKRRAGRDDNPA